MLQIESTHPHAVRTDRCGPFGVGTKAVVVDDHSGIQKDDTVGVVDTVSEVEVLRRLQRTAPSENLVEAAKALHHRAPRGEVRPHPEDPEAVSAAHALEDSDRQRGNDPILTHGPRFEGAQYLTVEERHVLLLVERARDGVQPSRGSHAIVVGKGDHLVTRLGDAAVVRSRESALFQPDISHPMWTGGQLAHDDLSTATPALIHYKNLEHRVVLAEHAFDGASNVVWAVAGPDDHRDGWPS